MKKNFYFLLLLGILIFSIPVSGQKTVIVVQPDEGLNIGALNNAVASAADPGNTIFELVRGGHYLLNGAISHSGYTLHIKAQDGEGPRPVVQPAVDELGASANHFNPGGNLTLEGLYIQGKDELGAIENRQIIVSGDGNRIIVDDCIFDHSNQAFFRLTSSNNKIYIRNSILRNSFRPENPGNGRIVDTRSNPQDTISFENNTLYNNSSGMIIRFAGAFVKHVNFNHNTVFQSSFDFHFILDFSLEAIVTNNIFYNFSFIADPYIHVGDPYEKHSPNILFSIDSIYTIGEYSDADRYFRIANNNWYNQQEFKEVITSYAPDDVLYRFAPDDTDHSDTIWYQYVPKEEINFFANQKILDTATVYPDPVFLKFIQAGQADTTNNFSEQLNFSNPPPLILDYWTFYVQNSFLLGELNPPIPFADEDPNVVGEVETGAFDFAYNSGSRSATAADDGLPLGDQNWPLYTPVYSRAVKNQKNAILAYPNPFDQRVTFEIELKKTAKVKISFFDIMGREISSIQKQIDQGENSITVVPQINNDGIYLYRIMVGYNDGENIVKIGRLIKK
jgi:hypothetical protein